MVDNKCSNYVPPSPQIKNSSNIRAIFLLNDLLF